MSNLRSELEAVYGRLRAAIEEKDRAAIEALFGAPFPGTGEQWAEAVEGMKDAFPVLDRTKFLDVREYGDVAGYYVEEELDDPDFVTVSVLWFRRGPAGWIVGQRRFGASFPRDPDPTKNASRIAKEIGTNPGFLSPEGKPAAPAEELPHPTSVTYSQEDLNTLFIRANIDRGPDPKWHFRMAVHKATKMRPGEGLAAPTAAAPMQSLGLFYREDVEADLEVIGVLLGREVDPLHWLEIFLDFNGLAVTSMKPLPLTGGIVGDALCEWTVEGRPFAGRFVALKFGPRLFIVCCRATRENYIKIAQDFFITLTQFGAIDETLGLCAEPVQGVGAPGPIPWKLFVPGSWQVSAEEPGNGQAGFQAVMSGPSPAEAPVSSCFALFPGAPSQPTVELPAAESYIGKLAFTVIPQTVVPTGEEAEQASLSTFREAGLELDADQFEDEEPQGVFERSRLLSTQAKLGGQPGVELRCRVGFAKGLWFVAGVVGPARGVNPFAWMQNKRALDVVTGSLQFDPA